MADDVTLPGTGAIVAADDVGGVLLQRVKNTFGDDGTYYDVTTTMGLPSSTHFGEYTGSLAATGDLVGPYLDAGTFSWVTFYLYGTFNATVQLQGSPDGVANWIALGVQDITTTSPAIQNSLTLTRIYTCPVGVRYIRLRVTSYTSGTVNAYLIMRAAPSAFPYTLGTATVALSGSSLTPNSDSSTSAQQGIVQIGYNGTNYDRWRNNESSTPFSSAARTTTQTGSDLTNFNGRGCRVVLNVSSAGTGSVTLSIQGKDGASSSYYTLLTGAAVTTVSTNVYTIYPGLTAVANAVVSDCLPRTWRVVVTANNANSVTYSVGAVTLL